MTERLSNLRLLALILAIAAGLILEAKAEDRRALAEKDCAEMAVLVS
ncbi:hypothetical protein [Jannaschia seohaensis]|uniref:Uncharacterized protein n=1 Tax=Jannaschia seohaensis TaxID=475081 RepID=A0A2Y9A3P1_9RHOB|nr:hypothetical protein [Jannaschia seohaensis]PWJ22198.1 hypothetical protein BCF38_101608 [Jannaschia seohaensis]SSA38476.1 hypothetical protein SAMN05421539_101608 [Jannaschia seohaensis]